MTDEGRRIALGNIADFGFAEFAKKIAFSLETLNDETHRKDVDIPDNRCEVCKWKTFASHYCMDCCRVGVRLIADTLARINNERDPREFQRAANSRNFFNYFRGVR